MSLLGAQGLKEVALASHYKARELFQRLTKIKGVSPVFSQPIFHEFVVRLDAPVDKVIAAMADQGIQAGFSLEADYPDLGNSLLVCATETKTEQDLERYQKILEANAT